MVRRGQHPHRRPRGPSGHHPHACPTSAGRLPLPGRCQRNSGGQLGSGDLADDGTYLRGAQVADPAGIVRFTTIYPGWYAGRTTHIHCKVHIDKQTVLTTQLYLDDAITEQVYTAAPYNAHTGRDTTNATDAIFDESGLLTIRQ